MTPYHTLSEWWLIIAFSLCHDTALKDSDEEHKVGRCVSKPSVLIKLCCQWHCLESPGKGVSVSDCLDRVGLWACLWVSSLVTVGSPSHCWWCHSLGRETLSCAGLEKVIWVQHLAFVLSALDYWRGWDLTAAGSFHINFFRWWTGTWHWELK